MTIPVLPLTRLRPAFLGYVAACLLCGVLLTLKLALAPVVTITFTWFFGAILLIAWFGGLGPGLLAALLTALAIYNFATITNPTAIPLSLAEQIWRAFSFFLEGALMAGCTAWAHGTQENFLAQNRLQAALIEFSRFSRQQDVTTFSEETLFARATELAARALNAKGTTVHPLETSELQQNPPEGTLTVTVGPSSAPLGLLKFQRSAEHRWTSEECEFVGALADTLAIAIGLGRAETGRAQSEQRYRAFVERSSEAIWRFELEEPLDLGQSEEELIDAIWDMGYLAECNLAFARMYGFESPEEMIGARTGDLLKKDDPANVEYFRRALANNCQIADAESVELDRFGQEHIFLNSLLGIIENNHLVRIWGTQRDITEQKMAAQEVEAAAKRFRALFDAAPTPICITRAGNVLYANHAIAQLFGIAAPEAMVGHPTNEFINSDEHATTPLNPNPSEAELQELTWYETIGLKTDGTRFPLRVELAQLELPDGEAILVFAFDLTEQKASEQEIDLLLEKERLAARRAQDLQALTNELALSTSALEIANLTIARGIRALGTSSGMLLVPHENEAGGGELEFVTQQGYPGEISSKWQAVPFDAPVPVATAFREKTPIWLEDTSEILEAFPSLEQGLALTGSQTVIALPLSIENRVIGVLGFACREAHHFDTEERVFLLTLASQCAQALDRQRLDTEGREMARRQQESLALLNTVLNSAPVGFALFDQAGRYILLNQALADIHRVPVTDHLGRTVSEITPDLAERLTSLVAEVWTTGEASGEVDLVLPDPLELNNPSHCLASFYPVQIQNGELLGVGAVFLDITERVRAEHERMQLIRKLYSEQARFEAILQQMPSAVIIGEAPSGQVILGNSQVQQVLGSPVGQSRLLGTQEGYQGYDTQGNKLSPSQWPLTRAITRGEVVSGEEIRIQRQDGSVGVIRVNASPIRDADSKIEAGIMVFDDVTQRARSNEEQRFLAEVGSLLVSTLDEYEAFRALTRLCVPRLADWCLIATPESNGFWHQRATAHADAANSLEAANFATLLASDKALPWDIKSIIATHRAQLFTQLTDEYLRQQNASEAYIELLGHIGAKSAVIAPLAARGRGIGVMIWLSAESNRVYDQNDVHLAEELARRVALTADNARLFQESQDARDEAEAANRAKDEFLAVVSHELRTPLTPILGWLELLRGEGIDDETRQQAYDVIERNANAQAQLVNDILDVSRITIGKLRLELKEVELAPLVSKAVDSLSMVAQEKGVLLRTNIQPIGLLQADSNRLQQVVWNLLQNALKFTPRGGTIEVSLHKSTQDAHTALLEVKDSGLGIETEFLPYVFDRFRQGDSSSTRKVGGLGLGLAIVQHIVEAHGGHVFAHSEGPKTGSTFRVELPLSPVEEAQLPAPPSATPTPTQPLTGTKILVVDDEPDTRDLLFLLLTEAGAQVQIADSGAQALESTNRFYPDAVVSDIGMAGMDGYELRGKLRERFNSMPVIALTAYASQQDAHRAQQAGFERYLAKPVGTLELINTVVDLLNLSPTSSSAPK